MIKQSKIHIFFLFSLGLMVFGQVGIALFQGNHPVTRLSQRLMATGGSAKAFGLVAPQGKHFSVENVKELDSVFKNWDFDLTKAKSEGKAPRLYLAKLPKDMTKQKKASNSTFIRVLLPHILQVNEKILSDRERLLDMQKRQRAGGHLRHTEKMWLKQLAAEYRCKSTKVEALLAHVDIVPPSLALSQGMIETGGGKSSAAINKNSTFGIMATKTKVAKFESLLANVKAYILNLNRHAAYKPFRDIRAKMRAQDQTLCPHKLAAGLRNYSIRKAAYIKDVQRVISRYDLTSYDHITLDQHMRVKP
ncbi:MAG: glucosaminidase domain-containing protein [Proteobacteria bacterium]|nr:glucosaminidase domain-containing protein [Pseudomonadota bacterium]